MVPGRGVAIIGAGMTRFHHKLHLEKTSRELFVDAALEAEDSVDKDFSLLESDALFLGNFSSDIFERQTHTAALMTDWLGLTPIPAYRVEDACASSGVAINLAAMAISSGMMDVVLVGGVEKMRTLGTGEITDALAYAADEAYEVSVGFTFPGLYASMASSHFKIYGSSWNELAYISIKNHKNGKLNPKAQYQSSVMDTAMRLGEREGVAFNDEMDFLLSKFNPYISHPLRLFDCCPTSDGAAAVILTSGELAKKYTDTPVYLDGFGQASDTLALHDRVSLTSMRASNVAAKKAYEMADTSSSEIDVSEVHDCFTIAELIATEDLGFVEEGMGGNAAVEGRTSIDGDIPVNPDGGLKAKGHPVGATGAGMVYELFKQLRGEASSHQVADAEIGLVHNVGAAGATVSVQIYRR
ncbi:MAG: thiolase C-terminal domain-containing protein [Candidatus Bathyarchaeia archaeon]